MVRILVVVCLAVAQACAPPITHPAHVKPGGWADLAAGASATRVRRVAPQARGESTKSMPLVQLGVRYGERLDHGGALYLDLTVPYSVLNGHLSLYYQLPVTELDLGVGVNLGFYPGAYVMAGVHDNDFDLVFGARSLFRVGQNSEPGEAGNPTRTFGAGPFITLRRTSSRTKRSVGLFVEAMFFAGNASWDDKCCGHQYDMNNTISMGALVGI